MEILKTIKNNNTRKQYVSALNKFRKVYPDDFNKTNNVMKAINNPEYYKSLSSKKIVLSMLIKITDGENKDFYKNQLNNFKQEENIQQEEKEDFNIDSKEKRRLRQRLSEMPDSPYKIIMMLAVFFDNVRSTDYFTIKIKNYNKNKDNYYDDGILTFNNLVKKQITEPIVIKVGSIISKMFDKVIENKEDGDDYLFTQDITTNTFSKRLTERVKLYLGIDGGFSKLRKYRYSDKFKKEDLNKVKEFVKTAKNQNHSVNVALKYYLKK